MPSRKIKRNAIFLANIGDAAGGVGDLTLSSIRAYAERIGATLFEVTKLEPRFQHPRYAIMQVGELTEFDRVVCIDADVYVKPDAPSIFEALPPGAFYALDEAGFIGDDWRLRFEREIDRQIGSPAAWDGIHFNGGVLLADREHLRMFQMPPWDVEDPAHLWYKRGMVKNQPYLNWCRLNYSIPFRPLPREWNALCYDISKDRQVWREAHFCHFAGHYFRDSKVKKRDLLEDMRTELRLPTARPIDVTIVMQERPKRWILERMADHLVANAPPDMRIVIASKPSQEPGTLNYYNPYRLYQPTMAVDIAFCTHPEEPLKWAASRGADGIVVMARQYGEAQKVDGAACPVRQIILPPEDVYKPRLNIFFPCEMTRRRARKGKTLWDALEALPWINAVCTDGKWSAAQVADAYQACDAVVVTSNLEGGPMAVVEGLACGKSIVAPHALGWCSEFGDSVIDYEMDSLPSLLEKLKALYAPKKERARRVAGLTWKSLCEQHYTFFREVAAMHAQSEQEARMSKQSESVDDQDVILSVTVEAQDAGIFAITGPCLLRYCLKHGYGFRVNAGASGQRVKPTVMLSPAAAPWPNLKIEPYQSGVDQPAADLYNVPAKRLLKLARRCAARWES